MPGFGTTGRTYQNALNLMQSLGITIKEINISQSVLQHFKDIGQMKKYMILHTKIHKPESVRKF